MTKPAHAAGKRVFDLFFALVGIILFAPLGAFIALLVFVEDRGPLLFMQERMGRGRRPFMVHKFRTMKGQRVTRVGKWLRETGLDEIPQVLNVLRGEMSIVGPRPLTGADVKRLGWDTQAHALRWQVRPGITGMAQLFGGGSAASSFRLDRYYIKHRSLGLDLYTIVLSAAVNILGKKRTRRWLSRKKRFSRERCVKRREGEA